MASIIPSTIDEILHTPLSIYTIVREQFPCARFRVVGTNPIALDIYLADNMRACINSAVHKGLFLASLMQARLKLPQALDSRHFSMGQSLSGLPEFTKMQRQIYESNGRRCLDVIVDYLKKQDTEPSVDLITLGLAPGQLTQEIALPYFGEIAQQFPALIQNLKAKYPAIFSHVQLALCKQDLTRNHVSSYYDEVLSQLRMRVLGQESAIKKAAAALAEDKKRGGNHRAFLFVGPSGVGKTELAKSIGNIKKNYIVFYMNQYPLAHDSTRFFGSPTGYLGSNDKPDLAKELDKCLDQSISPDGGTIEIKNIVILLDEFEKAHPTMRQSLLTLLEKGEVTISYTLLEGSSNKNVKILYKLTNSVIIGTSNLYQNEILQAFQKGESERKIEEMFRVLNDRDRSGNNYSPELLGRVEVIPFGPVPGGVYKKILRSKVEEFFQELKTLVSFKEIVIEEDELLFFECLKDKLYGNGTNIRKIKIYFDNITSIIFNNLSQWGDVTNKKVVFYSNHGQIWIKLHQFCLGEYIDLSSLLPPLSIVS